MFLAAAPSQTTPGAATVGVPHFGWASHRDDFNAHSTPHLRKWGMSLY